MPSFRRNLVSSILTKMFFKDLLHEHYLFLKLKVVSLLKTKTPNEWNTGTRGDMVLIPGFYENYYFLRKIGDDLNKAGYKIHVIPNFDPNEKVHCIYKKLEETIKNIKSNEIILVSHSKGGIVAKYLLDNSKYSNKVKCSISIATPYGGSVFAHICIQNIFELRPNSKLIKQINENNENLSKIYNFYPVFDNLVVPNQNLLLNGCTNEMIEITGHTRILESNALINRIKSILLD